MPGKFLRVQRDILITGGGGGDADEVGHPGGAAEWTSTGADTTDAAGFLACTDLLHLDTNLEGFSQHLDKLAEVDTFVGDVIENCLIAVALIFYVADLHVQLEVSSNLTRADHRLVFASLCLLIAFEVGGLRLAEHTAHFGVGLDVGLAHLQAHQCAGQ